MDSIGDGWEIDAPRNTSEQAITYWRENNALANRGLPNSRGNVVESTGLYQHDGCVVSQRTRTGEVVYIRKDRFYGNLLREAWFLRRSGPYSSRA